MSDKLTVPVGVFQFVTLAWLLSYLLLTNWTSLQYPPRVPSPRMACAAATVQVAPLASNLDVCLVDLP